VVSKTLRATCTFLRFILLCCKRFLEHWLPGQIEKKADGIKGRVFTKAAVGRVRVWRDLMPSFLTRCRRR